MSSKPFVSFATNARRRAGIGSFTIVRAPNIFLSGRPRGVGLDVLGDLADAENDIITGTENVVSNSLPTWLGGQPLTADELATIQGQAAQSINQASGGDTALAQQEIAQMLGETAGVQSQAQTQAQAQDTSWLPTLLGGTPSATTPTWLSWLEDAALIAVVVVGGWMVFKVIRDVL